VLPTDKAPDQTPGIYIFDPDMNPLIATEGYVRGLTEFVDCIQNAMKPGLDTIRTTVIDDMINGTTLMSLDWGDTGPASVSEQSVVKNKLGFALTPGVTEYYDWVNKTWVTMPEGEIHQTPTHAYNGWSYYITSQSQNPEAAWAWIKFHGSPGISAIDVASPDSGFQPWRKSHETNLEPWLDAGWDEAEAQAYIATILAATDHPNAVFDPRLPGAARYQETLELYTNQAIAGELTPQAAMDQCTTDFNAITDELGRDSQIAAYRAHLGMTS
jgi:multiple sugar transport system substrate-binding protein